FEEVKLKKDGLDGKLARLLKALKNLDHLIESQRSDQVKEGVGYNVVPPPAADLYLSPKKDLSWIGLPEFMDDTMTDYSRPLSTVVSTSAEVQTPGSSISNLLAVGTTFTGSGNLYCQWELSPGSGNALYILFTTPLRVVIAFKSLFGLAMV
nr:hypothetical protein [Tanacetum cinerariifolium]